MKKYLSALCASFLLTGLNAQTTITVLDDVVFFDGYASVVSDPMPAGIQRLRNDLVTTKLSESQLAQIGDELTINVTISALCDNYDRIGSVNLAMVPKGSTEYNTSTVSKIEIGRFITPFMNKNYSPTSVPYSFEVNNICSIFKSPEIVALFDFWLELEVFGVPYAANSQVAGCSGRSDVFEGQVDLVTNTPEAGWEPSTVLQPLSFKADFNDYQAGACDEIGTTLKTITFTTDQELYGATLYLITSNHGANSGGEEYIRRMHYIIVDDEGVLQYKPGGKSCEPYRVYNTQANGIYGQNPMTEAQWLSFNNWCPGDAIPIRTVDLGTFAAGTHTFVISVPQAIFTGNQGNFPLSVYLQGSKTGLGLDSKDQGSLQTFPNPAGSTLDVKGASYIAEIEILNPFGQTVLINNHSTIDISSLDSGMYFIRATFENGTIETRSFVKQ